MDVSWTFDANAPQVNEIQVGKVLFATDRCAGKVLAVQHNGNSVSVVLGPVQLNELVKEGNFAYDQPLDLNNAIAVVAPDYPGAVGSKALQQEIQKPSTTSRNTALGQATGVPSPTTSSPTTASGRRCAPSLRVIRDAW